MLSATASPHPAVALAAVAVTLLVLTLGYLVACAVWPYANCIRCHGAGKFRSPTGKAWRNCPRCKGTGRRVRIGRRIHSHLARTKTAEHKANRAARRITDRNDS